MGVKMGVRLERAIEWTIKLMHLPRLQQRQGMCVHRLPERVSDNRTTKIKCRHQSLINSITS